MPPHSFYDRSHQDLAGQYAPSIVDIRRHIHANPELSYQEYETSAFIQQKLSDWGIPFTVMAETGVCGIIRGKNPDKKVIALRADMDALPIREQNDVSYKSKTMGSCMPVVMMCIHPACSVQPGYCST